MIIGIPREIKHEEFRVSVTPAGVAQLKQSGHTILVEVSAGLGSGFLDNEYLAAGADIVERDTVFNKADLIVKVKEPLPAEYDLIRDGQSVFTYLHLAPNRELTDILIRKRSIALAYETLERGGTLPLLTPMSEVAGRMAPLMGAFYLQRFRGGRGILPTGLPGVRPARALVIGAGVVGSNAIRVCHGLGMEVTVMNRGVDRLRHIDELYSGELATIALTPQNVVKEIRYADIVIGAVLVPGGRTPVIISRDMLKTMQKGSVIVDVSIDQGGCAETSRPTTHDDPVYEVDGVIHYTVANMPGAYPRTSTLALTNATLPYIIILANSGIDTALSKHKDLRSAVNIYKGIITNNTLADTIGAPYQPLTELTG